MTPPVDSKFHGGRNPAEVSAHLCDLPKHKLFIVLGDGDVRLKSSFGNGVAPSRPVHAAPRPLADACLLFEKSKARRQTAVRFGKSVYLVEYFLTHSHQSTILHRACVGTRAIARALAARCRRSRSVASFDPARQRSRAVACTITVISRLPGNPTACYR